LEKVADGRIVLSPTNGSEFQYDKLKWNLPFISDAHNCYDYAFGTFGNIFQNTQPGELSGIYDTKYTCDNISELIQKDHPGIIKTTFSGVCPDKTRKIVLMSDPERDYHFMKLDSNGLWSHKNGFLPVNNVDASGELIYNPELADRNFPSFNYSEICNYFCI
jgi:hypothetical protein